MTNRETNALVQFYRENGYVVLKEAASQNNVQTVISEIHRLFKEQLIFLGIQVTKGDSDAAILANAGSLFHHDLNRYKATLRQVNKLFSVQRLLTSDSIIDFVKALGLEVLSFPTDAVFHCMAGDLLIPNGYMRLIPHQDWPAMQSSLDSVIVWSSLMDVVSEANFPLEVIPGSHRNGLLPGITNDHVYEVMPSHYDVNDFKPISVEKGDVIVFSSFLIHRTGKGEADRIRFACSTRYENVVETTNIQRAYPSIHRRIVDREIKTKDFPERKHVAHLFEEHVES